MPCTLCPHPTCRNSMIQQGVCACPECDGTLVLDPVSAPKWRLDCNKCSNLVYLPHNAHKIAVCQERCDECGSSLLEVYKHVVVISMIFICLYCDWDIIACNPRSSFGSKMLISIVRTQVNFNKNSTPLPDGATLHKACLLCDKLLYSLVEVKHGRSFFSRSGRGRGRGRGRQRGRGRGRGRSRGRGEDPRMSFRDF